MTLAQFRAKMLGYALGMGKALCESMSLDDTKIEQEQVKEECFYHSCDPDRDRRLSQIVQYERVFQL